jgi:hypothetical protein
LDTNFIAKRNDVLVFKDDIRPGLEGSQVYKNTNSKKGNN